jgi:uncharacterized protein YukE
MARMGMDADVVEQSGRQLKSHAASIGSLVSQLDRMVNGLTAVWDGQDAQRFVHEWWPQHRKSLTAAQQQIDGLGQSALNNASEQRQASSGGGGAGVSSAAMAGGAVAAVAGASSGAAARADAARKFVDKWNNKGIDVDGRFDRQCVDVFRQYSKDVVGHDISSTGLYAKQIYTDYATNGAADYYDRIPAGEGGPQPGDVIVYQPAPGFENKYPAGHVAVVTEVGQNGDYKVIEQNYSYWDHVDGNDNAAVRQHNLNEKGTGVTVLGYLRPKKVA